MKIDIRKPIGYTHIGRKDRQEDAVWPLFEDVSADNRCIVLCDGVGGSEHGEIASQTSSRIIGEYLTEVLSKTDFASNEDVQTAVNLAYDELDSIDKDNEDGGRVSMATTLTCVCFHKDGIMAAHMGDSRIYQVRPGEGLKYKSDDHSLVNALVKAGELTPEEAENFPRKNVITKAIQPHTERRFKAECHQLTDVKAGDYIFLCCDGVLEQVTDKRLVEVLSMSCPDEEKLKLLEADSIDRTRDNYTAYLIPIESVEGESTIEHYDVIATVTQMATEDDEKTIPLPNTPLSDVHSAERKPHPSKKVITANVKILRILSILAAIVLILLVFFVGKAACGSESKKDSIQQFITKIINADSTNNTTDKK